MSILRYFSTLYASSVDGSALANSTTPTSLLPSTAGVPKYTMPAGFLQAPGDQLLFKAHGRISNIVTTPGTLTLELRLGSVIIASSGAMVINTAAKTNVSWCAEWELTVNAVGGGTSANFMHQGKFFSESVVSSPAGTMGCHGMPASAPAVGTGFDSGAAAVFDFFATWQTANAGNSIQCHRAALYAL